MRWVEVLVKNGWGRAFISNCKLFGRRKLRDGNLHDRTSAPELHNLQCLTFRRQWGIHSICSNRRLHRHTNKINFRIFLPHWIGERRNGLRRTSDMDESRLGRHIRHIFCQVLKSYQKRSEFYIFSTRIAFSDLIATKKKLLIITRWMKLLSKAGSGQQLDGWPKTRVYRLWPENPCIFYGGSFDNSRSYRWLYVWLSTYSVTLL